MMYCIHQKGRYAPHKTLPKISASAFKKATVGGTAYRLLSALFSGRAFLRLLPFGCGIFLMLFGLPDARSQSPEKQEAVSGGDIQPLQVGDTIPEELWKQKYNFLDADSIIQSDLMMHKGKFLLLDFWATWCSACVKNFKKIDSLQYFAGDHLDIVLVNKEKTKNIEERLSEFFKDREDLYPYGLKVRKMIMGEKLNSMFPHKYIPYYVLIDEQGVILSMGNTRSFNAVWSIISAISKQKGLGYEI